jgi:hypothetical protein
MPSAAPVQPHLLAPEMLAASYTLPVSMFSLLTLGEVARSNDMSYDIPEYATVSAFEVNVGIICACLPVMRPLFALLMPKYFSPTMQHTEFPPEPDTEQLSVQKHVETVSMSIESLVFRKREAEANTPGVITPQLL